MDELTKLLAGIFQEKLKEVLQREVDNPDYLPQGDFADSKTPCTDRAERLVSEAQKTVIKTLGLCVAESRTLKQGEDHSTEMVSLESSLTEKQIGISTRGWWRG